jgi:hypothetical protein
MDFDNLLKMMGIVGDGMMPNPTAFITSELEKVIDERRAADSSLLTEEEYDELTK